MLDRPDMDSLELLRAMCLIRSFEAALMARPDRGFQLFSSGQEAVAVGVCAALTTHDQLLCSGRSIGPALARGLDPRTVMAELLGRRAGPSGGKGGRGHMAQPQAGFLGAHAVVGGNLSIAAGAALAAKLQERRGIVMCIFGDGACGSGALHETLNISALWNLPLVLVCDNNQLSISTPRSAALAPKQLSDLARPFGIVGQTVDGMDVVAVREAAEAFVGRARQGGGPAFLECVSERFSSHSTGTRETRSAAQMAAARERCPIRRLEADLLASGAADQDSLAALRADVERRVADSIAFAEASTHPEPAEAMTDVG
jgi:TPP-dependent pyruvate/acetoin dehydrogenase alpha subunit